MSNHFSADNLKFPAASSAGTCLSQARPLSGYPWISTTGWPAP
jgi:hypothetical protein